MDLRGSPCHDLKVVPYRCKGHFCTTYSCAETEEWSPVLSEDVCQVNHRHVILTIDESLREMSLDWGVGVSEVCP
uniref:transposase zinc-binding domain-containing protein n=1 Tax=Paenibacillus marchantiophytorum TaxID=1619310 RepID=UPI00227BAB13|nr:transposase zinc-binding domain-containing protein [Paenibacillus marchantiophytorum]